MNLHKLWRSDLVFTRPGYDMDTSIRGGKFLAQIMAMLDKAYTAALVPVSRERLVGYPAESQRTSEGNTRRDDAGGPAVGGVS